LKENPPSPSPTREKREAHDAASGWLHENSKPKIGCHYFWPGLIVLPKNTLPSYYVHGRPTGI